MRAIKNLLVLAIILGAIGGGAVVALRIARGKPSAAETVKTNVVAVSAAGIYNYAVRVGSKVMLFDTGADPGGHPVDAVLAALGAGRNDVSDVFLTHGHGDHAAGAAGLGSAKIHIGQGDVALAEGKAAPDALVAKLMVKVLAAPPVAVNAPIAGTGIQTIDVGEAKVGEAKVGEAKVGEAKVGEAKVGEAKQVKAFPMPGHTPGSYAFLYDGVLFVGDAIIFKQGRLDRGPSFLDSDKEGAKRAIASLKQQLADTEVETICTGHGGCTPKGLGKNLLDDLINR